MVPGGREPIRVLIVDDDARVRSAMRTFLLAHPEFEVVGEAGCPESAVRIAEETAPGVAIVDVLMPTERDGLSLLEVFARHHGIPVVAMSLDNAFADRAIAAGAYAFLAKDGYSDLLVSALLDAPAPGRMTQARPDFGPGQGFRNYAGRFGRPTDPDGVWLGAQF